MHEHKAIILVRDVMTPDVECAHVHEPLQTAVERMAVRKVNVLPVLDGDKIVGMIGARDIFDRAVSAGIDLRETEVHAFLSANVISCQDDHTLKEAAAIMEGARVRHLPVLNHEQALVGILSLGDLVRNGLEAEAERVVKHTDRHAKEENSAHAPTAYSTKPTLTR